MGIITAIIVVVTVLAILGLGPKAYWEGITAGYDKAIKIGGPMLENITNEAQELAAEESTDAVKRVITN